jgi:predicted dehydrogenase
LYQQQFRESRALAQLRFETDYKLAPSSAETAIIGCGNRAHQLARAIKSHLPKWRVSALVDPRPESIQRIQAVFPEGASYQTLDELLPNANKIDAFIIATTAPTHFELCRKLIESGAKNIFLEKPVTNCLSDADALVRLAAQNDCRVAVDHTRRFAASVPGLKRLLRRGVVGEPQAVHFLFGRAGFAMIGSHLFDLARWLLDGNICRIRAELDSPVQSARRREQSDDRCGRCEGVMSGGQRIFVDLSESLSMQQFHFVVMCEHGRLEVDERLGHARLVGTGGRAWETDYVWPGANELGVAVALHELVGKKALRCTLLDGLASLEAAIACNISSRENGRWVDLPLPPEARREVFGFA